MLFRLVPRHGRRLEQASVTIDQQAPRLADQFGRSIPLSYALLLLNATQMGARRPFLSIGSNANPTQLYEKLTTAGQSVVVPLTMVHVDGLSIGYSNHRAKAGYVPAAPFAHPSARDLVVAWLDYQQASALNETEPNYVDLVVDLVELGIDAQLPNHEPLAEAVLFKTRRGLRTDKMGNVLEFRPDLGPFQGSSDHGVAADDGLHGEIGWPNARTYAEVGDLRGRGAYQVLPTKDMVRAGDCTSVLSEDLYQEWGRPPYVLLTNPNAPDNASNSLVTRAVGHTGLSADQVRIDQLARNALGIEVREGVDIRAIHGERGGLVDRVFANPTRAVCRVQSAESATMERDIAMLDSVSMAVIGVAEGDLVVIEGVPDLDDQRPPEVRLRVVTATDEFMERRRALVGGNALSRYPSALDTFGVWPDLPWVYLDAGVRERLKLGSSRLAAVRIRASRRDQIAKELRELILVLAVALVGVLTVVQDVRWMGFWVALIICSALVVVMLRLRRRISKT
jgi:hypothetical protein